ncbi:U-box domain-containing protein [Cephalotus follicularis]|uniref:U-box domain-containing protein n=1 Tax=Cephalotus follicularis TaxID=3775 RepID=A0A1Q3CAM3_CEPFO|nr:U-box domain-containing protein [Cephalotus follicularis]
MAVSPKVFPARKRRPSAGSFVSPKLTDQKLLQSLVVLSHEVSSLKPLQFLLKQNSSSIIRKTELLSILFEELLRNSISVFSSSTLLCIQEMYIVLHRIKTLIEDCSNGSKMWLLMQNESMANNFHQLTVDLSTLLDIFPCNEVDLSQDVEELVVLIRKQCAAGTKSFVEIRDSNLKDEVLSMIDRIKREIVPDPSKLKVIFHDLGLIDSAHCWHEIESLEDEIQNQIDDKSKSELVALIGLVRYSKCVLFGAAPNPKSHLRRLKSVSDINIPADFRCPISLELMRDPVVVATGQTYDRESISLWIESGHSTCPKTGQILAHTNLVSNFALKNLIALWCREQRIPFQTAGSNDKVNRIKPNKAALEATKMTASFLVNKLSSSQSIGDLNGVV